MSDIYQSVLIGDVPPLDDYNYEKKIGKGSFGTVWLGHLKSDPSQKVAIKILNQSHYAAGKSVTNRLFQENDTISTISQENLVQLVKFYTTNEFYIMILSFCNSEDQERPIKNTNSRDKDALFLMGCIVNGFRILNMYQIMHRDLKPMNLFMHNPSLGYENDPTKEFLVIGDFGGLKVNEDSSKTVSGSPKYLSPENFHNYKVENNIGKYKDENVPMKNYNDTIDVFSLGCIGFEILTGKKLLEAEDWVSDIENLYRDNCGLRIPFTKEIQSQKKDKKFSKVMLNLLTEMTQVEQSLRMSWHKIFKEPSIKYFYLIKQLDYDQRKRNLQEISNVTPVIKNDNFFQKQHSSIPLRVPSGSIELDAVNGTKFLTGNVIKFDLDGFTALSKSKNFKKVDGVDLQYDDWSHVFVVYGNNITAKPQIFLKKKLNRYTLIKFENKSDKVLYYYKVTIHDNVANRVYIANLNRNESKEVVTYFNQTWEIFDFENKPKKLQKVKVSLNNKKDEMKPIFSYTVPILDSKFVNKAISIVSFNNDNAKLDVNSVAHISNKVTEIEAYNGDVGFNTKIKQPMIKNGRVQESNPLQTLEIEYNLCRGKYDRIDFVLHVLYCLLQFQQSNKSNSNNEKLGKIAEKASAQLYAKSFFMLNDLMGNIKDYSSDCEAIFRIKIQKLMCIIKSVRTENESINGFIKNCKDEKYLKAFQSCENGNAKDPEQISKLIESVNKLLILEVRNLKNECEMVNQGSDFKDSPLAGSLLIELSNILVKLYKTCDLDALFTTNCFDWKGFLLQEFNATYIKSQIRSKINNI